MSDFTHAINLTHDGALILRIPKGYKVDKVVVEEMGTENRKEYQPTRPTPSNTLGALDCVDRQAAMKIRFSSGFDNDGILFIPYRDVEEHLKKLPSVQPRRVKWIKDKAFGEDAYVCSYCQTIWKTGQIKNMDFCPTCGADMRGEEMRKKEIIEKSYEKWEEEDAKKLDIGGRISNILYEERMTQRELAQKCHITEVSMSRYINNTRMPKGTIIVSIAKALGVSADYLLGLSELRGEQDDSV